MTNIQTDRRVILFGQAYSWERRATDGGKKAPKRKKGQLLLRRVRGKTVIVSGHYQPSLMAPLVAPCQDRIQRPIPGYVGP